MPSVVTITVKATGQTVQYLASGEITQLTDGNAAKVTETDRPGRTAATRIDGWSAMKLTAPGYLDAFPYGSVEPQIQALHRVARPAGGSPSPIVTIHGDTIPPQVALVPFIVSNLTLGDDLIRRTDGARCRQPFTLELTESVDASVTVRIRKVPKYRMVPAKKGETIQAFARRVLKDAKKAKIVVGLNKPWALKAGQVIKPAGRKVRVPG